MKRGQIYRYIDGHRDSMKDRPRADSLKTFPLFLIHGEPSTSAFNFYSTFRNIQMLELLSSTSFNTFPEWIKIHLLRRVVDFITFKVKFED